jgi:hypothetical protein
VALWKLRKIRIRSIIAAIVEKSFILLRQNAVLLIMADTNSKKTPDKFLKNRKKKETLNRASFDNPNINFCSVLLKEQRVL